MKINPRNREEVYRYMYEALLSEGLQPKEMTYESDYIIVTDVGFFTYIKKPHQRYPYLHHFYINPKQRSLKNFLRLVRELKQTMSSTGYSMFIAQQPRGKAFLGKFIKFAKGVKAFKKEGHTYYLVPASLKVGTRKGKKA